MRICDWSSDVCSSDLTIDLHATHRKHDILALARFKLGNTQAAQPFAARAFEKTDIAGVIHHAASVGIFPIHPTTVDERRPNPGRVFGHAAHAGLLMWRRPHR